MNRIPRLIANCAKTQTRFLTINRTIKPRIIYSCLPISRTVGCRITTPIVRLLSTTANTVPKRSEEQSLSSDVTDIDQSKLLQSGGLFGKWPIYPMFGLGAAILLSKELLLVNEEFLVGCTFVTFMMGAYIMFQEQVARSIDSSINELRERHLDVRDISIDHIKRLILIEQQNLTYQEDVKALYDEEMKAEQMAVEYKNAKHKLDIKTAMLQKLQTLRSLEEEELQQIKAALVERAGAYSRSQFEGSSEQEKAQTIDDAIDLIPTKVGEAIKVDKQRKDRITAYFDEYFKNQYTLDQLGVSSRVSTFLAKENQAKH